MKADVDQKSAGVLAGSKTELADRAGAASGGVGASIMRSRLFFKYTLLFVSVVVLALFANGGFEVWFSYQEHKGSLISIQQQQAIAAADKIEEFITQIESQVGWTTQLPWTDGTLDQRRFDALRLLRQVPAITELAQIDAAGREQLKVSRLTMDVVGSGIDYSGKPEFTQAVAKKVYYGPVYFRRESEPYMTLSLAGARRPRWIGERGGAGSGRYWRPSSVDGVCASQSARLVRVCRDADRRSVCSALSLDPAHRLRLARCNGACVYRRYVPGRAHGGADPGLASRRGAHR